MDIAFVLYDGFTALDLVSAYEPIASWPGVRSHFLATENRPHVADHGLIVSPTDTPATLPRADIIVIPGSSRPLGPLQNEALLGCARRRRERSGARRSVRARVAAAGVLGSHRVTTHWAFRDVLAGMGATVSTDRVVIDPPFISGAGVSAASIWRSP
jgi:transcriptional regulator GlxA family with amidase domain